MEPFDFKYTYHSHTHRCGHAFGEDEEFVIAAINAGIKVLCFTDHTPIPNVHSKGMRMDYEQLDEYVSTINKLKEKYKEKNEIHIGLEVEYNSDDDSYIYDYLKNHGVEFIILGQHLVRLDNEWHWLADPSYPVSVKLNAYVNSICTALNKGLTKYIAHPDLFPATVNQYTPEIEKELKKVVECAIKNNAYLEYNIHGIINTYGKEITYPNPKFWEMVKREYPEAKITVGLDIHGLSEYKDCKWLNMGLNEIKRIGLNVTDSIVISKELKPFI